MTLKHGHLGHLPQGPWLLDLEYEQDVEDVKMEQQACLDAFSAKRLAPNS